MIALLWAFRVPLAVLLAVGVALSYAWPQAAREQFAAQLSRDMCAPPHACPAAQPVDAAPALLQMLSRAAPAEPGVVYSEGQLEGALQAQGVAEPGAHVGAAVGEAESGGRSDAKCDSCAGVPELSLGPWQLNVLAHPWISRACAMALGCAAWAAARISDGGRDWSAWTTWRTGAWRAFA